MGLLYTTLHRLSSSVCLKLAIEPNGHLLPAKLNDYTAAFVRYRLGQLHRFVQERAAIEHPAV